MCLAQIHTESTGYVRPEDHIDGPDYSAEGILQIQGPMARDCGYDSQDPIDGDEVSDAYRSIDCWAKQQSDYNRGTWGKGWPQRYDIPLFWLAGPGTLSKARDRRSRGTGYWLAWYAAADETVVGAQYVYDYAVTWTEAVRKYMGIV